jgi:amino acid transporter
MNSIGMTNLFLYVGVGFAIFDALFLIGYLYGNDRRYGTGAVWSGGLALLCWLIAGLIAFFT